MVLTFTRDERASDLLYEVQVSNTLNGAVWTTIASSTGGQFTTGTELVVDGGWLAR